MLKLYYVNTISIFSFGDVGYSEVVLSEPSTSFF